MRMEERIKEFDALVKKAAEIHPYTWCVKGQSMILTIDLIGSICCECKELVLNGGVCDPL